MKLDWDALDQEIQTVESALTADRTQLASSLKGCVEGARHTAVETLTSPKFLLGALGVGFIAGRFLMRGRSNQSRAATDSGHEDHKTTKRGVIGLIGATAFSLLNRHFGGPLGLARWAISQMSSRRSTGSSARAARYRHNGPDAIRPTPRSTEFPRARY